MAIALRERKEGLTKKHGSLTTVSYMFMVHLDRSATE